MDPTGLAAEGLAAVYNFLQDYIGGLMFSIVKHALTIYPDFYTGLVAFGSAAFPIFAGLLVFGVAAALISSAIGSRAKKQAHASARKEGMAAKEPVLIVPLNHESLPRRSKYRNADESVAIFTGNERVDAEARERLAVRAMRPAAPGAPLRTDFAREAVSKAGTAPKRWKMLFANIRAGRTMMN